MLLLLELLPDLEPEEELLDPLEPEEELLDPPEPELLELVLSSELVSSELELLPELEPELELLPEPELVLEPLLELPLVPEFELELELELFFPWESSSSRVFSDGLIAKNRLLALAMVDADHGRDDTSEEVGSKTVTVPSSFMLTTSAQWASFVRESAFSYTAYTVFSPSE